MPSIAPFPYIPGSWGFCLLVTFALEAFICTVAPAAASLANPLLLLLFISTLALTGAARVNRASLPSDPGEVELHP